MIRALVVVLIFAASAFGGISDGVVASVDDDAITRSELEEAYAVALIESPDATRQEVLNTLINRLLLLREARKLKTEALDDEHLIEEYINLKVRAMVTVSEDEVRDFYDANKERFKKAEYKTVKKDIESYLTEERINQRLKKNLEELKARSRISVFWNEFNRL